MCEALMEIMKKDIDKKVAEGRAEGREAGKDEANINNIRKIMKKMKFSSQKAMDFMEISAADQERYAPLLREQSDMKMPDEN